MQTSNEWILSKIIQSEEWVTFHHFSVTHVINVHFLPSNWKNFGKVKTPATEVHESQKFVSSIGFSKLGIKLGMLTQPLGVRLFLTILVPSDPPYSPTYELSSLPSPACPSLLTSPPLPHLSLSPHHMLTHHNSAQMCGATSSWVISAHPGQVS